MGWMHSGASLAGIAPAAPPPRPGMLNPATRFRKLLPFVGTALVLIVAISGYASLRAMAASRASVAHTYQIKAELADLQMEHALLDEDAVERAADPAAASVLGSEADEIRRCIAELKELTRGQAVQQDRLTQLEPLAERHIRQIQSQPGIFRPLAGPPGSVAGLASVVADNAMISRLTADIDADATRILDLDQGIWNREFRRNIAVLAFAVGACLVLLITNMHFLRVDVRSSRIAAEQIRESADSYRALSSHLIGLQDIERRRLGRELHDSVGQSLSAVQMILEQMIAGVRRDQAPAMISEAHEIVSRTAQEVRTISQLLHPPLLDMVGFTAAARNYLQEFSKRSNIEVKLDLPDDLRLPSKEIELALFRVLQESLTNVRRHAQASSVEVGLRRLDQRFVLTIHDNGRGLAEDLVADFEAGKGSGVGLAGMRERLAEFGGTLTVESTSGTTIHASVPA